MSRITVHEDIFMLCPGRAPLRTARRARCALWAGRSAAFGPRVPSRPRAAQRGSAACRGRHARRQERFCASSARPRRDSPWRRQRRRTAPTADAARLRHWPFTFHSRQRAPSLLRCARRRGAGQSAVECANHLKSHILGCQQRVGGGDGFLQQGDQVSFSASRLFVLTDELLLQLGHLEGVELLRQRQRCYWHLSRRLARRRARLGLILHAAAIALVILNGIAAGAPSRPLPHPDLRVLPHRLRALALGRHRLRREAPQGPW